MGISKITIIALCILFTTTMIECKIILPQKLRYLENMLNSEVVAKAARIRQRMEANPNMPESDKGWPALLAKYQVDDKNNQPAYSYNNLYNRRMPSYK